MRPRSSRTTTTTASSVRRLLLPFRPPLASEQRLTLCLASTVADWEGATHGFAIRGDPSDPKARQMADGAFEESVKFLQAKL